MKLPPLKLPLGWVLTPRLKAIGLYAVLGLLGFVFFLYWTFPYEAIQRRIEGEARGAGYSVKMASLGPGFFGVHARRVQLAKLGDPLDTRVLEPLLIDSLSLRPTLFPPGVAVHADLCGGSVSGAVGGTSDVTVRASLSKINLAKGNLKAFSGVDLDGVLDGQLALDVPATAQNEGGKSKEANLAEASGSLTLTGDRLIVKGGTVTVPLYGTPTPVDLPRVAFGNLDVSIRFDKGMGTVERLTGRGGDLELQVTGTVKLARELAYSDTNLGIKIRPEPALMKNGFIGMGISALPPAPDAPEFRAAKCTGMLGRPSCNPGT